MLIIDKNAYNPNSTLHV